MEQKKNRSFAISQIILLLVSLVAFGYIVGSEFKIVSAGDCTFSVKGSSGAERIVTVAEKDAEAFCASNRDKYDQKCQFVACIDAPNIPASTGVPSFAQQYAQVRLLDKVTPHTTVPATEGGAAAGETSNALSRFLGHGIGGELTIGRLIGNAAWAASIYYGFKWVLGSIDGISPELADSVSKSAAGGFFVAKTLSDLGWISGGLATTGVFLGVGAIIFIATYKKTKYEVVEFTCQPWDAKTGGENCEKCNEGPYPCTEYQCRSLGQGCQLVNQDVKGEELCVWVNRGDVKPPVIQPWSDALTLDYKYTPNNAISPPDRGVNIVRSADLGCIKPFTPLKFGVTLDEPAKCKIDFTNTDSFDAMKFWFGGSSTSKYNHSQTMSLPSPEALAAENITLENGAEFNLFTRCQDANGNTNTANFVFSFCVDEGPDTTPPLIVTTSILNGFPISAGQTSADLQVYTNEPSECRWSQRDQSYDNMENQMSCNSGVLQMNSQNLYACSTTLTGLKDRVANDFYFRCKDQPSLAGTDKEKERNANSQSYKFTLQGTQPLVLNSVGPNGTIRDATNVIGVNLTARTSAGYKNGEATCYFSSAGNSEDFIEFYDTGSHSHKQDLYLPEGNYTYNIKCVDLGGNTASNTTSFQIETDTDAPIVVRAFHQETALKIITDENATCVYDNFDCNYAFEDGIPFTETSSKGGVEHSTEWTLDKDFYVKCADEFNNQPDPNECNIIVRPSEI